MISIIESGMLVPVLGVLAGIIIPASVFIWLYYEGKGKRETIREIAKNMDDPSKLEDLLGIFEERKKQPIDYRRSGVITLFCWYWYLSFWICHSGHSSRALDYLFPPLVLDR